MTGKQKVLVIVNESNRLRQYFSALQEKVENKDYGFTVRRLDVGRIPTEIIPRIGQHLSQRNYDMVLSPLEMDLAKVVRQHHEGLVVGYTYLSPTPEDDMHDEVLRFALLRDFSGGLVTRIKDYLRNLRS